MNAHIDRLQHGYTSGARRAVAGIVSHATRLPVTANQVTAAGFLLNVAAAVLIFQEWWIVAGIVFIVGSILDVFDGAIARSRGSAGPRGAFIDSVVDRVSEVVVLGAIALVLALDHGIGGALEFPSAYLMKSPPVQHHDEKARDGVEAFIEAHRRPTGVESAPAAPAPATAASTAPAKTAAKAKAKAAPATKARARKS